MVTLWGCDDANNSGQQLENLNIKKDLILLNYKIHTYFHSASGTFTSIDQISFSRLLLESWSRSLWK